MNPESTSRAQELRLIGWSQDGATKYAEILGLNNADPNSTQIIGLASAIIVGLILIIILLTIKVYENTNVKSKDYLNLTTDNFNLPEETSSLILEESSFIKLQKEKKTFNDLMQNISFILTDSSLELDSIIIHFLFLITLLKDGFNQIFITSQVHENLEGNSILSYADEEKIKVQLSSLKDEDIKRILEGEKVFDSFNSKQLVQFVLGNEKAIEKLNFQMRKSELMSKSNSELKLLLNGVSNISKLKKKQLVDRVLSIEYELEHNK